jgi:hypothetical protein
MKAGKKDIIIEPKSISVNSGDLNTYFIDEKLIWHKGQNSCTVDSCHPPMIWAL